MKRTEGDLLKMAKEGHFDLVVHEVSLLRWCGTDSSIGYRYGSQQGGSYQRLGVENRQSACQRRTPGLLVWSVLQEGH